MEVEEAAALVFTVLHPLLLQCKIKWHGWGLAKFATTFPSLFSALVE